MDNNKIQEEMGREKKTADRSVNNNNNKNLDGQNENIPSIDTLSSRITAAEKRLRELEDEMQKVLRVLKNFKIALGRVRVVSDEFWKNNVRIIRVPEREGNTSKEVKTVKNIIAKTFPELEEANTQIQAAQRLKETPIKDSKIYPIQNIRSHR